MIEKLLVIGTVGKFSRSGYNEYNVMFLSLNKALCSGSKNLLPRNITRTEGTEREIIPCQTYPIQATPFWKINGTIYYYSDVPPLFVASRSGREIIIPIVEFTLSGTSFQCFFSSSSDLNHRLVSSFMGVLTVTTNGIILTIIAL